MHTHAHTQVTPSTKRPRREPNRLSPDSCSGGRDGDISEGGTGPVRAAYNPKKHRGPAGEKGERGEKGRDGERGEGKKGVKRR